MIIGSFAGAVSISSLADIMNEPGVTLLIGCTAGICSIILLKPLQSVIYSLGFLGSIIFTKHFFPGLIGTSTVIIYLIIIITTTKI